MENSILKDGNYHLPLPIRSPEKNVPNNRQQVVQRTVWLKKKLLRNEQIHNDYHNFIEDIIAKGFAKVAEKPPTADRTWYIPHHGVYHPQKPGKIRVVFDCSIKHKGYCLNQEVLQGPDLTNQLVGVLLRFRQEPIAVMADVESMFYQVKVHEEYHDYLRFVWWPGGDLSKELVDYQLRVHLQGASSSPSCANFALRKTADDNEHIYGKEAGDILRRKVCAKLEVSG